MTPNRLALMLRSSRTPGRFVFRWQYPKNEKGLRWNHMMDYARQRAIEALKPICTIVLATDGPAGILESEHPCESIELELYILLPRTSDHLFNLEQDARVALLTDELGLRGNGRAISPEDPQPELKRLQPLLSEWYVLVKVEPSQIQFRRREGWGPAETIDLAKTE